MAGFDQHLQILAIEVPERMEFAVLAAVRGAFEVPFDQSQVRVPVQTGKLKSTGLLQAERQGTTAVARISYGDQDTVRHWGGANSAGFGAKVGSAARQQGPIWSDVGYEVFVHEGVFDSATGTHAPNKFLEGPVLEASQSMEADLGRIYQQTFEAGP
jgi:hypothetical protein